MLEEPPGFQPVCATEPFMHHGLRVLDLNGRWMRHWDDVPRVMWSDMKGWEMEALMRRNPELQISDIQARMKKEQEVNALTNRMMRFRRKSFNLTCKFLVSPPSHTHSDRRAT